MTQRVESRSLADILLEKHVSILWKLFAEITTKRRERIIQPDRMVVTLDIRGCLPKSGLVDLGSKIDFAHFVCVERLSCTYTKTKISLIGSLKFLEF